MGVAGQMNNAGNIVSFKMAVLAGRAKDFSKIFRTGYRSHGCATR